MELLASVVPEPLKKYTAYRELARRLKIEGKRELFSFGACILFSGCADYE